MRHDPIAFATYCYAWRCSLNGNIFYQPSLSHSRYYELQGNTVIELWNDHRMLARYVWDECVLMRNSIDDNFLHEGYPVNNFGDAIDVVAEAAYFWCLHHDVVFDPPSSSRSRRYRVDGKTIIELWNSQRLLARYVWQSYGLTSLPIDDASMHEAFLTTAIGEQEADHVA